MPKPDATPGLDALRQQQVEALPQSEVMQRLADALVAPFLLEGGVQSPLATIWEAGDDAPKVERQRDLRHWLAELEANQQRAALNLQTGADPRLLQAQIGRITAVRQEVLTAMLEGMRERHEAAISAAEKKAKDAETGEGPHAFMTIESRRGDDDIETEVEKLEEHIWNPPDPEDRGGERNPLYYKNNRATPYYPLLDEKMQRLQWILDHGIDTASPDAPLTRERIERLQQGLRTIATMNPIAEQEHLARKARGPGLLNKPLKLAGFGIATVLGVMSLIPVLRKLHEGENLSASDWPAAAWPALALYMGGFLPKASKGQLEKIAEVGVTVQSNEAFRTVIGKCGGVEIAIPAVEELHDLLLVPQKRKLLKGALALRKIPKEFLRGDDESFTGQSDPEKSALLKALSKDALTDEDRHTFLGTLYDLQIHEEGTLDAMKAALSMITPQPSS